MTFKHSLGTKARDRVSQLEGILTMRGECLFGCNRYYLQPRINADGKVPEGWWVDEDAIELLDSGAVHVKGRDEKQKALPGGPMSKKC